jgi:DNA repair photolyase
MIEAIEAKSILSKVKNDHFFGLSYNMNLYRGCQHGCIYCDSRSKCYQLGELSYIRYKKNALELLEKELYTKKVKGTIGFGSMNDPYMPVEKNMELTRKAIALLVKYKYPLHLITKSNLVVRDLDLLKKLKDIYVAISFTITTANDELARIIEPNASLPSERFEAIRILSENGIYCGITLMPILPYINDTEQNITDILTFAGKTGVKYIIPFMGLTLREGSREYFYQKLEDFFPGNRDKYINSFGNIYVCNSPNSKELYKLVYSLMKQYNIPDKMEFYNPKKIEQLKLF